MGHSSQRKGRNGERELASLLREYGFPAEVGEAVSFGTVPDLTGVQGVHVECKRVERLNLNAAVEQACRDSERFNDGLPAVFHRQNRKPWLVTMRLSDWVDLYNGSIPNKTN